eukprot:146175-Prorocentrum_minimum.AAC.1
MLAAARASECDAMQRAERVEAQLRHAQGMLAISQQQVTEVRRTHRGPQGNTGKHGETQGQTCRDPSCSARGDSLTTEAVRDEAGGPAGQGVGPVGDGQGGPAGQGLGPGAPGEGGADGLAARGDGAGHSGGGGARHRRPQRARARGAEGGQGPPHRRERRPAQRGRQPAHRAGARLA